LKQSVPSDYNFKNLPYKNKTHSLFLEQVKRYKNNNPESRNQHILFKIIVLGGGTLWHL
jgi:hypothetical protein